MSDLLPNAPREYRFTGEELALEMNRELAMRESFYPRRIADGRMTKADAARKIAMAKAVIEALQKHALDKTFKVPA